VPDGTTTSQSLEGVPPHWAETRAAKDPACWASAGLWARQNTTTITSAAAKGEDAFLIVVQNCSQAIQCGVEGAGVVVFGRQGGREK